MTKKENKIHVVIAHSKEEREHMIAVLAVKKGFAKIKSDALKIVRSDIYSVNIATAYFVMCSTYNFRGSSISTQRLYELAAKGLFVCVGVKSLPREYEFFSQSYYPEDLL
ncbi:MAG: hypothetical protein ACRC3Z_11070 [Phocaeicola sp.]